MPSQVTDCCGAKRQPWQDDGGAAESLCDDCSNPVCEACAAVWDVDGGYGEGGASVRTHALCRGCYDDLCGRCHKEPKAGSAGLCQSCNDEADAEADREYRQQMRDWRNDSGV